MDNEIFETTQEMRMDAATTDKKDFIINKLNSIIDENDSNDLTAELPFQNTAKIQSNILSIFGDADDIRSDDIDEDMDDTMDISGVDLQGMMEQDLQNNESKKDDQGMEKGKQLVKTKPGAPSYSGSNDIGQIITSFVACVQLAGITALIGAGWLVNLIMHLK